MNMKKFLAAMLGAATVFTLSACGTDEDKPDVTPPTDENGGGTTNPDGNGGGTTNPDGNGGGTTNPDGNGGTDEDNDGTEDEKLNLSITSYEFYNGNHIKVLVSSTDFESSEFADVTYTVTSKSFPYLRIIESFNGGFTIFLDGTYGQGVDYVFDIEAEYKDLSVKLSETFKSPGTPIDPSADIVLPNIEGLVTHGMVHDYVVDFGWVAVFNTLKDKMVESDITNNIVYEYRLFDTDNNREIITVNKPVTNTYTTSLLPSKEVLNILLDYSEENNLISNDINFTVNVTVKAKVNHSLLVEVTNGETVTSNNVAYTIPAVYTDTLMYNELLPGYNGSAANGQIAIWANGVEGGNAQLEAELKGDELQLMGLQSESGAFWQTQLFAKFNPVTQAGLYRQSFVVTSSVDGDITINGTVYNLVANQDTTITLLNDLAEGQFVSLSIQFGSLVNGVEKTIGNFDMSITGFELDKDYVAPEPTYGENAFSFGTFLPGSTNGEGDVQLGQIGGWGNLTTSYENDTITIISGQAVENVWWATQFFAKFYGVAEAGEYTETLTITSDVAGDITINGTVYTLVVGENTIDLTFNLAQHQNASLSIQFGKELTNNTIGAFEMTISGFTQI